jgi:predicted acetyltransferase
MASQWEYSTLASSNIQQLGKLLAQCFVGSPSESERYAQIIGSENFRELRQAEQLVGGLALIAMGQWWGEQSVPMTGIASVGIAPEQRGSGAAIALLQHMLRELYEAGVPLSALYPATQRLYRKAGYEQGGSFCGWEIAANAIQARERSLPVQTVDPSDRQIFEALYQKRAKRINGHLDRATAIWQQLLHQDEKTTHFAYRFGSSDRPQGYVVFSQQRSESGTVLKIHDWAVLTTDAAKSFWAFLGDHRSQIDKVQWKGGAIDPLALLLPEQTAKLRFIEQWFLRIVNVRSALEKRGYPAHLQTELHLEVQDDLLPANTGKFILSVANGRGEVTAGGKGELKLNVQGLAPLYTGLFTPQQLQFAGYLEATEVALAIATQLFTGASPWMPDFF